MEDEDLYYDEWDYVEDLEHAQDDEEAPEHVASIGKTWTVMSGAAPPKPTPQNIDDIRKRLRTQLTDIIFSTQTGAWLVRHPPGVGKTYTFSLVADEYETMGQSVIMCAPTIAEAERLADGARCYNILRSQTPENCQQAAHEQQERVGRPLEQHRAGRHRGSDFCAICPFMEHCKNTEGQYRYEQKQFAIAVGRGTAYYATTVSMLEYVAATINESKHRAVIWTDEDLLPHVAKPIEQPITREEVAEWIAHACAVGGNTPDIAFMRAVLNELNTQPLGDAAETHEDHGTARGRSVSIPRDKLETLRGMARGVLKALGKSSTHATEMTGENGEPLTPGHWRRATIKPTADLILGACWVHIDRSDYRSLVGKTINREILKLPKRHALLQSDATASPRLWSLVWGDHYRGAMDCMPPRAATVSWIVGGIGRTGRDKDVSIGGLVSRIAHEVKANKKKVGLITYKDWCQTIKLSLRGKQCKVFHLAKGGDGDPKEARVIIGHYGAHDRGVDSFHQMGIDMLFIVGPFRLPMSEYHQQTKALLEMGAAVPESEATTKARVGPVSEIGEYIVQAANRATVCAGDAQTSWVADHERAAALTQAIERVRSVDRYAKGQAPAEVVLWGIDATRLHIPIPVQYIYPT